MAHSDSHSSRRQDQRNSANADEVELSALRMTTTSVETASLDERVSGEIDEASELLPGETIPQWQALDLAAEDISGSALACIQERARILGTDYPFRLTRAGLAYSRKSNFVYEFCLLISQTTDLTSLPNANLVRAFERLTASIAATFLGLGASTLHIGHPRDAATGAKFSDAMKRLNAQTEEWVWNPESDMPPDGGREKDGGADFVAWKDFGDNRPGRLFVVGQCACGDDWTAKFGDLNLERLRRWFHPMTRVTPVRAFAVPFDLSRGHLIEASLEAGLILDRIRLTKIAASSASPMFGSALRAAAAEMFDFVHQDPR